MKVPVVMMTVRARKLIPSVVSAPITRSPSTTREVIFTCFNERFGIFSNTDLIRN